MASEQLVARFRRELHSRIGDATDLWLAFEGGEEDSLGELKRLLHTLKGEAYVLDLGNIGELAELTESLVQAVSRSGSATSEAGDAILSALEAIGVAGASDKASGDGLDLTSVQSSINAALAEFGNPQSSREPENPPSETLPGDSTKEAEAPPPGTSAAIKTTSNSLELDAVAPQIYELSRLHAEQEIFHRQLREVHRMLRALAAELDPRQSAEAIAERIAKTLGYSAQIARSLERIRSEWSASAFSAGLALGELQTTIERASFVSASRLEAHIKRVARSAARSLSKEVNVRFESDDLLDAGLERRLEPVLAHLARNAVDHGIEGPERRRELGKAPTGEIHVTIRRTESGLRVVVSDDGSGIDIESLRSVLSEAGYDVDKMGNNELGDFLFKPGITTKSEVSSISGRGIGMDVVAKEIRTVGGQVQVESTPGRGMAIILLLPETLHGDIAVPVRSGSFQCAIPARSVFSVLILKEWEESEKGKWVRIPKGSTTELVPLHSLAALLGEPHESPEVGNAVLVLETSSGRMAVSVSEYQNPRPLTIQRNPVIVDHVDAVHGVAPTPDGGVLLLLKVDELVPGAGFAPHAVVKSQEQPAKGSTRSIVIAEDAPVARELLGAMLRGFGFSVKEAPDGRRALALLLQSRPDVLLTDLEMPYMGGIELIRNIRDNPQLADLPVLVLTTADTAENNSQLGQLGVRAILSKQNFVEEELRRLLMQAVEPP